MKARAGTVLLLSRHAAYVGIRIAYVSIRIAYVKACGWNCAPVKPLNRHTFAGMLLRRGLPTPSP
jgi:hypothetical protein